MNQLMDRVSAVKNPCRYCPERGCGRQGQCEEYMEYFAARRELGNARVAENRLDDYRARKILKIKRAGGNSLKNYQQKGIKR